MCVQGGKIGPYLAVGVCCCCVWDACVCVLACVPACAHLSNNADAMPCHAIICSSTSPTYSTEHVPYRRRRRQQHTLHRALGAHQFKDAPQLRSPSTTLCPVRPRPTPFPWQCNINAIVPRSSSSSTHSLLPTPYSTEYGARSTNAPVCSTEIAVGSALIGPPLLSSCPNLRRTCFMGNAFGTEPHHCQ